MYLDSVIEELNPSAGLEMLGLFRTSSGRLGEQSRPVPVRGHGHRRRGLSGCLLPSPGRVIGLALDDSNFTGQKIDQTVTKESDGRQHSSLADGLAGVEKAQ